MKLCKGREDGVEDVTSKWMALRKREEWTLKEEALDGNLWRTRRRRRYGCVARQTTK